jgi:hypothetical protein
MNKNIKAGADIHAGDGGYSIGTKEKHDEFAKGRNQSLGKMRIRELMLEAGTDISGKWMSIDHAEKFAKLIVRECVKKCDFVAAMAEITNTGEMARKTKATADSCAQMIEQHFGVEE